MPVEDIALRGRRAIVTGGTSGIGRAIAGALAQGGAAVFVCGHDQDHLSATLAELRAIGPAAGVAADLARVDAPAELFAACAEAIGVPDIAVLAAALPAGGLTALDEAGLREVVAVNFTAYLACAQRAAAGMTTGGDIVLVGSYAARKLGGSSTVYAAIKAGIEGLAVALRRELAPRGIRVTLITPGLTDSAMIDLGEADRARRIAADEMLLARDVADACRYAISRPRRVVLEDMVILPRATDE